MKLGVALPYGDVGASVESIRTLAQTAEHLGYDSVWALQRDVFPDGRPTPASADARAVETVRDPLGALAFAATATERIGIGLSIVNAPFHSPVSLATSLAALDRLSNGRVELGIGVGFSESECVSVTTTLAANTPAAEFVRAFESLWSGSNSGYQGEYFYIPRGISIPAPVQSLSPRASLVAFAPAAVLPSSALVAGAVDIAPRSLQPGAVATVAQCMKMVPTPCPYDLPLAVRARVVITAEALGDGRPMFQGSVEQVRSDIALAQAYRVNELLFDPGDLDGDGDLAWVLSAMRRIRDMASGVDARSLVASA